jgi:Sensors of blue-light using FAD
MQNNSDHSHASLQLESLIRGLSQLGQLLDHAVQSLHAPVDLTARQWVDISVALRRHRLDVSMAVGSLAHEPLAHAYLERMHQLRRDIAKRIGSLGNGQKEPLHLEQFETLCWESLASGVMWLDTLQQRESQPARPSTAGQLWERIRSEYAVKAVGLDAPISSDFEIDQILYCSLARDPMDEAQLESLTHAAQRMNRMDHITGMLMHADGVFVQLFEGPRQAVEELWVRLLHDPRHLAVVQLYHRREVESRACKDWGMQFVDRDMLRALIHEAMEEVKAGRQTAWAPAIERMDFLLNNTTWGQFVENLQTPPASTPVQPEA